MDASLPCTSYHSVVVVGAGVAGLYTAKLLQLQYPDLLVVEASHRIGGRIQQVEGLVPWPVELGPEFVHGGKSSLQGILRSMGVKTQEYAWPDRWYFGAERRLIDSSVEDPDLEATHALFAGVGDEEYPAQDLSAEEWMRSRGANDRMVAIADACYANDFGCSISQLGLREMITENRRWDSGETYLVLDRSLRSIVEHLAEDLHGSVRLSCPIHRIEHSAHGALLHGPEGVRIACQHVVVTVPVSLLQREQIVFAPALPEEKLAAIQRVKISNAVKVILAFSRPFWPAGFFDVVCTDSFIPEFWVTDYPATSTSADTQGLVAMVGFAAGLKAEEMSHMRASAVVQKALDQLDQVFGSGPQDRPATAAFVRAHIADWSREPYIRGAYTYPTKDAKVGDREALAEPIGLTVFFAGEATHPAINPCIQAALETGQRVAAQIQAASGGPQSKL
ncbi:hypothetical protein WJX72_010512 [[Myrmecia] bisecta]|uniref:Amine oxidase domain-containing protein n=1 Tax=[Myrmecia] bisecta TaxID=41462 RepID=A0AAW1P570_9CHLO